MLHTSGGAIRFVLVASALALGGLAQYFIRDGNLKWAVAPLVVAVAAMTLSVVRRPLTQAMDTARSGSRSSNVPPSTDAQPVADVPALSLAARVRRWRTGLSLESELGIWAIFVSAGLMLVSIRGFGLDDPESLTLAWYSFGASVVVLLAALPALENRYVALSQKFRAEGGLRVPLSTLKPWVLLAGILALALALRLYNLEQTPAGLWFDEADNLLEAREIARDPGNTAVYAPSTNLPTLFLLPIAALVKLTGTAMTTGRVVAVAFGLAGIVTTFLFARLAFGGRIGLLAAFLVAVMRWDLNWSRIGMHGITAPFAGALIAYLTLRALRSGRVLDYGFAGASLGLGMWLYASLRMFPLVVGFMLLHHLVMQRPGMRLLIGRALVMAVVALAVAAPVVQVAIEDSDLFFDRTRAAAVFNIVPRDQIASQIKTSLAKHVMMFNERGDPNPRHNLPDAPMLDYLTGLFMLLGLGIALWRWRDVALFSLPFWMLFMVAPGVLTVPWEAPQSLRSITVIPATAALAALAISVAWRAGREAPWIWVRRAATPAILILLSLIAYDNVDTYFDDQANDPKVYAAFSTDETLMARDMNAQQRRGYTLWISRQYLYGLTTGLLADHPRLQVIDAPLRIPIDSAKVWRGASIYLEPRETGFFETMRAYYPEAQFEEIRAPGGNEILFYSIKISAEQLADRQGLRVSYLNGDGSETGVDDVIQDSTWHVGMGPPIPHPYQVFLEGSIHAVETGEYTFRLEGDVGDTVTLDGEIILDHSRREITIVPSVGLHALSIRGTALDPRGAVRLLWRPPEGEMTPIPLGNLYRGSVRPMGLAGLFYAGDEERETPDQAHITPSMDVFYYEPPVAEPSLAIWRGTLKNALPGEYNFRVAGSGSVKLFIDGAMVATHAATGSDAARPDIRLRPGDHPIRVEYMSSSPPSDIRLLWSHEQGDFQPIPPALLEPSAKHMFRIVE